MKRLKRGGEELHGQEEALALCVCVIQMNILYFHVYTGQQQQLCEASRLIGVLSH